MKVQTEEHVVNVRPKEVEYIAEKHDITLALSTGNRHDLRMTYEEYVIDQNIMSFYLESKHGKTYAHLNHLFVPDSLRGFGIGKLCLSIFYSLLKLKNIEKFSIKFGGGKDSGKFLRTIGFDAQYIETSANADLQGDSVVVGDYKSFGRGYQKWTLDPISISNFPTEFFD